jgi:hypothetical protein
MAKLLNTAKPDGQDHAPFVLADNVDKIYWALKAYQWHSLWMVLRLMLSGLVLLVAISGVVGIPWFFFMVLWPWLNKETCPDGFVESGDDEYQCRCLADYTYVYDTRWREVSCITDAEVAALKGSREPRIQARNP